MAVNEQFYGNRDNWVVADVIGNRPLGQSVFYDQYYPPMMTGMPDGKTDGRFVDYYDAGLIDRQSPIDDSPTYTYTDVYMDMISWVGQGSSPDYDHWTIESTATAIYPDVSIMFQACPSANQLRLSDGRGIDGGLLSLEGVPTDYCNDVSRYQNNWKYAPMYEVPDSILSEAIIVANDDERYQITAEQVTHDPQYVYVQNTQNLYTVNDISYLDRDSGYTFEYSQRDYLGYKNRPLVSFCPKNYILVIRVYCRIVWSDEYHVRYKSNLISMSSGFSQGCTLKYFLDNIQTEIDRVTAYNAGQDHSTGYYARIEVYSACGFVYGRNGATDNFQAIVNNNVFSTIPLPNIMFNNIAFPIGGENYIFYTLNQHSGVQGNFTVPIFGIPEGGSDIFLCNPNYRNPDYSDRNKPEWWTRDGHESSLPILFGLTDFFPRHNNSDFLHASNGTGDLSAKVTWVDTQEAAEEFAEECRKGAAKYGLFFCDDYNDLEYKDTSKIFVDDKMMCGTIDEYDGRRFTYGDYTSGADNINQPQFYWIDSEGHTWNPNITWSTDNDYPQMTDWNLLEFDTPPLPVNDVMTTANDYPTFPYWNITPIPVEPYPYPIFVTEQNYPDMALWDTKLLGAFAGLQNLTKTEIASSVSSIGYNAYAGTNIKSVELPENCTYYATSFPADCVVTGGQVK